MDDVVDLWAARNDCYLSSLVSRFPHLWLATWLYLRRLGEKRGLLYLDPRPLPMPVLACLQGRIW